MIIKKIKLINIKNWWYNITLEKNKLKESNITEPEWINNPKTGKCPVPDGHDVEVMFRDGTTSRNKNPLCWKWGILKRNDDILAYRDWTTWEQQLLLNCKDLLPQVGMECFVSINEQEYKFFEIRGYFKDEVWLYSDLTRNVIKKIYACKFKYKL